MLWSIRYQLVCWLLRLLVRCGLDELELETVVLRHQLKVLRRGTRRALFTPADRAFLAAAVRVLPRDRWKSFLVGPETLTRWHGDLTRRRRRSCRRPGRPPLDSSIKRLILRLGRENPRWGYLRIRGELLKLGVDVSATTIATVLREGGLGPAPRRIGPTWSQFLRLHASGLLSRCVPAEEDSPKDLLSGPGPRARTGARPTPTNPSPTTSAHRRRRAVSGTLARVHPGGRFRHVRGFALGTAPRWPPDRPSDREGPHVDLERAGAPSVTARWCLEPRIRHPVRKDTAPDRAQPQLLHQGAIEFLYPTGPRPLRPFVLGCSAVSICVATYEVLELSGDPGLTLVTYSTESGSPSVRRAVHELARWSATREKLSAVEAQTPDGIG